MSPFFFALLYVVNAFAGVLAAGGAGTSSAGGQGEQPDDLAPFDANTSPEVRVGSFGIYLTDNVHRKHRLYWRSFEAALAERWSIPRPTLVNLPHYSLKRAAVGENLLQNQELARFVYLGKERAEHPALILATPLFDKFARPGHMTIAFMTMNKKQQITLHGYFGLKDWEEFKSKMKYNRYHDKINAPLEQGHTMNLNDLFRELELIQLFDKKPRLPPV